MKFETNVHSQMILPSVLPARGGRKSSGGDGGGGRNLEEENDGRIMGEEKTNKRLARLRVVID